MSTINIEVTKNVYDVDLQQNVTSYDVTLEKGYYPLPISLENYYTKPESDARFKPINYVPEENDVTITVGTYFASVGQYQRQFNQAVSDWRDNIQLQIDDLDSGKADVNHTHTIGQITHLQTTLDGKLNKPTLISPNNFGLWNGTTFTNGNIGLINEGVRVATNLLANSMYIGTPNILPTESLEVNGNVKAIQFKDPYGTLKSQRPIIITGNTTLSEIHNGAVLNVTNTCNITIPTDLDVNFQCVIFAKGSIIVTFVSSGVTIYAPSGLLLKQDKMASLISTSTNNFNLTGELATS